MKYNIYMEGFAATGQSGKAHFVGTQEADSFQEACNKQYRKLTGPNGYDPYYNPKKLSYWGCRLYPTLKEASRFFG